MLHLHTRVSLKLCTAQSVVIVANVSHVLQLEQAVAPATDEYFPIVHAKQDVEDA
jgi:flagellar biosynthesis regulator FlbT